MCPFPVSAFGVTYPSIRKAAAAFNLPESTLRNRLFRGHAVEPEVALVCLVPVRVAFIGLNSKAYHPADWIDCKFATARQIVEHYRPDLIDAYDAANPTGKYNPCTRGGDS